VVAFLLAKTTKRTQIRTMMTPRRMFFPTLMLATLSTAIAAPQPGTMPDASKKPAPAAPVYKEESPLPKGWPAPGPFNEVSRKQYPAYRAAFTKEGNPNGGFWKLFQHIERQKIPMTAPVEMKLDPADTSAANMEQMAFLYQSPETGKTGADGEHVEVRDVPKAEALSYAWQGGRDKQAVAHARAAIDARLKELGLKAAGYRLLGYNSPFVPRARQTHELQALLP
jgi:SOUL heme-binding protein